MGDVSWIELGIELGVVAVGALVLYLLLTKLLPGLTSQTKSDFDDFVFTSCAQSVLPFAFTMAVGLAVDDFSLPEKFINGIQVLTTTAFVF